MVPPTAMQLRHEILLAQGKTIQTTGGSQVTAEGDGKEKRRPSKKQHYSFQWWNIFDFFIVLGTDLGLLLVAASDEGAAAGPIATAVRVR